MKQTFFVTGTDTGVGKTLVTAALLQKAGAAGLRTLGLKPVAAGCDDINGQWCNEDALLLQQHSTVQLSYDHVNPIALRQPIAPHIAAMNENKSLSVDRLVDLTAAGVASEADFTLIEGAGGWRVPLNDKETLAELPKRLGIPVLLVVGMRLGCLNHALLTAEAIMRDGLTLAGWVANIVDNDMSEKAQNLATLRRSIPAPLLGCVQWQTTIDVTQVASELQLPTSPK